MKNTRVIECKFIDDLNWTYVHVLRLQWAVFFILENLLVLEKEYFFNILKVLDLHSYVQ